MMVKEHNLGCDGWNDAYLCRRCFKLLGSLEEYVVDMLDIGLPPYSVGGLLLVLQ
jgi:hypothetical protein